MGISRSATVVIACLIATSQMTPHEALAAVWEKRAIGASEPRLHATAPRVFIRAFRLQVEKPPLDEKSEAKNRKGRKQCWSHSPRRSGTR